MHFSCQFDIQNQNYLKAFMPKRPCDGHWNGTPPVQGPVGVGRWSLPFVLLKADLCGLRALGRGHLPHWPKPWGPYKSRLQNACPVCMPFPTPLTPELTEYLLGNWGLFLLEEMKRWTLRIVTAGRRIFPAEFQILLSVLCFEVCTQLLKCHN